MKIDWSIGSAISMYLLTCYGFEAKVAQSAETVEGPKLIMSTIPASVALLAAASVFFYRIDADREKELERSIAADARADAKMRAC